MSLSEDCQLVEDYRQGALKGHLGHCCLHLSATEQRNYIPSVMY